MSQKQKRKRQRQVEVGHVHENDRARARLQLADLDVRSPESVASLLAGQNRKAADTNTRAYEQIRQATVRSVARNQLCESLPAGAMCWPSRRQPAYDVLVDIRSAQVRFLLLSCVVACPLKVVSALKVAAGSTVSFLRCLFFCCR